MLPALGIGALIGALGAKQRGGNMLKGALTGAALGGIGGWLGGGKAIAGVGGKGGLFGFGNTMMGNLMPGAMIGLGTEMAGQQEANLKALEGRRRLFREEEDERLRRLSQIAGYDVADPTKFLTPQSYFGRARGGLATLPHYNLGGPVGGTWADVPMEEGGPTMDPEIMQLPMGQEGSFEDENEGILGLDLAGLSDSERAELQSLMSLRLITPKDDPKYPQIEMRIQELMQGIGGETAMSEPHPDEGAYDMFFDQFGRYPKDPEELRLFLDDLDLDTVQVAQGGLMRLHAKDGLWANIHAKRKRIEGGSGETMRSPGSKGAPTDKALRESQATGGIMGYYGGGMSDMDLTQGGASFGPGTGTSDDIPAMLSDGEFVVTANAVKNLGGGNRMLGAKRMYSMMNSLDPNSQTPAEMDTTGIA